MNDACCTYELSTEELDNINGGFGRLIVIAFGAGVVMDYKQTH
jgi:lactobin A/cerein 7B family class IIb bacteriocin